MDQVTRAFRDLQLRVALFERRGKAFQDFFSEILELRHPGDFQRVCTWGNIGDRKCDGFRSSDKTLFAVYAPDPGENVTLAEWIKKIDDDFRGTLPFWNTQFDRWTFVHNREEGLPPDVLAKLNALQAEFPKLVIGRVGPAEIRQTALSLDASKLESLLGPAVSSADFACVGFEQIRVVVETVAKQPVPPPSEIRPVPAEKIEANALGDGVATLLKAGMERADVVSRFFSTWHDTNLGDQVAQAFRTKYDELRGTGIHPDLIFSELWVFAGGKLKSSPDHEAAVLAVLANLFEACDIFERPREEHA